MNLNDLQQAWQQLTQTAHIAPIRDATHYNKMVQLADSLVDAIGDAEQHPLLDLLDIVSELIRTYDAEHYAVPDASPRKVLAFLMEQHELGQSDLPEVGNQSVISMLLSGTRQLNVRQINALSKRFGVPPGVFLEQPKVLH
ncbi:MAG: transcriptional regulator [Gallionella sp.]|nr:transcriptional regulator [Gallionella sp.]